jgi:4-amino-4-deoxy-L-arabinose transferase-like glycosyltransferase
MQEKIKKFISTNYLLMLILLLASFLRFFRINELLGFWYDQGRDALVIWDFIYKGKTFLIGPTTGIEGVFRGPWYYWVITPFYFLGKGNPLWPNIFLILTSIVAIFVLYKLGEKVGGQRTGLLAALTASVSYYVIGASRWLSNPTPMLIISVLLILAVFRFLEKKTWSLPLIALLVGMALQFGSAMEIWYIPALALIFILKRKILPGFKIIILSSFAFLFSLLPQILFEVRHPGVLSGPIIKFLFQEKSFTFTFWQLLGNRLPLYYNIISSKFWINGYVLFAPFLIIFVIILFVEWAKFWKEDKFKIIFIFSVIPFIGGSFFSGNYGNLYDYYFTGYYLIWVLLFSFVYMSYPKKILMKVIIGVFVVVLIIENMIAFKENYFIPSNDPKTITFSNQLAAVDWIYKSSEGRGFNVDEYVPPVIPYAYQYLFTWLGTQKYQRQPLDQSVQLLYTLYEVDLDHPERLTAWLDRQKGIGNVLNEKRFGAIVVQERQRIISK